MCGEVARPRDLSQYYTNSHDVFSDRQLRSKRVEDNNKTYHIIPPLKISFPLLQAKVTCFLLETLGAWSLLLMSPPLGRMCRLFRQMVRPVELTNKR